MTVARLAPRWFRRLARPLYEKIRKLAPKARVIPIDQTCPRKTGVLFIGYAEGALGLGEAFRSDLTAVVSTGMDFAIYPFRTNIESRLLSPYMPERYDQNHIYDINIIEVSADQLPFLYATLNPALLDSSYNVLRTYWELSAAPEAWRPYLSAINEIWAPNTFVAESFKPIFKGPIRIVQPVVNVESSRVCNRANFGMEDGRFYFMFSFDYHSTAYRKNPAAALRAFQLAFPLGTEHVGLVIKSNGKPELSPDFVSELTTAAANDRRIVIIKDHISREGMLGLIQVSDAYISLHRAEGFGFGMAEALGLGKIVIATGYSGNVDFLTEETGFPVPFSMRPVAPHQYVYAAGQSWAEPDVQAAADIMVQVAANPEKALLRAKRGQDLILTQYNTISVGRLMSTFISDINTTIKSLGRE